MDQSLIASGFDVELLIGSRYIEYILLSFTETGAFPLQPQFGNGSITVFQPNDVDRLYEPNADAIPITASASAFNAELLFNHPTGANVRIDLEVAVKGQHLFAFANFGLVTGANPGIRIEVLALQLSPDLEAILVSKGMTDADLLAVVKTQADRTVPLPFVGADQDIEQIAMLQLPSQDGGPVALGFYINLRLRSGPRPLSFLDPRGDVFSAMNFLEDGQDIAFGVRPGLLNDMAQNLLYGFAQETSPGSGQYSYPMYEDMFDPSSKHVGNFSSFAVTPHRDEHGLLTGEIDVIIRGEYFVDHFFDPDFTFTLTLVPSFDDGVVTWSHRTNLDSTLASVLAFLVAGLVGLVVLGITEGVAADGLVGDDQRKQMTAFLAALPVRVLIEPLRWDPFYTTNHQIVTRVDQWIVNDLGIAFAGRAALGKEIELVDHVVIRNEVRDADFHVVLLEYRVADFAAHVLTLDTARVFSATDRMDWSQNAAEPALFDLTAEQIVGRIQQKRILAPIEYLPKKVHLDDHKVFRMLCISTREVKEQIDAVIAKFRRDTRAAFRTQVIAELTLELGMAPTQTQVDARFNDGVDAVVAEAEKAFRAAGLDAALELAIDGVIRFDMAPNEFGLLQRKGILDVVGFDLIERHNRKFRPGTVILYYRDRADFDERDNLLNKIKYAIDHRLA